MKDDLLTGATADVHIPSRPPGGEALAHIRWFLGIIFAVAGYIREVRALNVGGKRGVASGYFDAEHIDDAARRALYLTETEEASGVYVTMNPVDPELLARAPNSHRKYPENTTTDDDILFYSLVYVDIDPIRISTTTGQPLASGSKLPSSASEHAAALDAAQDIHHFLRGCGFEEAIVSSTGNGAGLVFRVAMSKEDGPLIRRFLGCLAGEFNSREVVVDTVVHNPSRILRIDGTMNRKATSTEERPHRRVRVQSNPQTFRVTPRERFVELVDLFQEHGDSSDAASPSPEYVAGSDHFLYEWVKRYAEALKEYGLSDEKLGSSGRRVFALQTCPVNPEHDDRAAYIGIMPGGQIFGGCHHEGCKDTKWQTIRAAVEAADGQQPDASNSKRAGRPRVVLSGDLHHDTAAVHKALGRQSGLYRRGDDLVRVRADGELLTLDKAGLRQFLCAKIDFQKETVKRLRACPPSDQLLDNISATFDDNLPRITYFARSPFYTPSGVGVSQPGYHTESEVYAHFGGFQPLPVSTQPTADEVEASASRLLDLVCDFPFDDDASRANFVALLITLVTRLMIDGRTPLFLIGATVAGTGKTLLATLASLVCTGHEPAFMSEPRSEEELRKSLTSHLDRGSPYIVVDNINQELRFGTLAAFVTAPVWEDRRLGVNKLIRSENNTVLAITANQPDLSAELARRCALIQLDANLEDPTERGGFRHPNLLRHVRETRAELLASLMVLVAHWIASGRPAGDRNLASFEPWAETVGGILAAAGVVGFLGNQDALKSKVSREQASWRAFVAEWWADFAASPVAVSLLVGINDRIGVLDAVLTAPTEHGRKVQLGKALARREGQVFKGLKLTKLTTAVHGSARYVLLLVDPDNPPSRDREVPFADGLDDELRPPADTDPIFM